MNSPVLPRLYLDADLGHVAAGLFEQLFQVTAARTIHGIHCHAQLRPADCLEIDQSTKVGGVSAWAGAGRKPAIKKSQNSDKTRFRPSSTALANRL